MSATPRREAPASRAMLSRGMSRNTGTWNAAVRATGLCTLLVLAFHSTSVLALDHDPGHEHHGGFCRLLDVPFLQPDLSTGDLPPPVVAGFTVAAPLPAAASTLPCLHVSRGPPA